MPLFSHVPERTLNDIISKLKKKEFKQGERIVKEGDANPHIYIVIDGRIDISVEAKGGQSTVVRTICEGEYFGEVSVLEGTKSQISAHANTPATLLEIDHTSFNKILKDGETKTAITAKYDLLHHQIARARAGEAHPPLFTCDTGESSVTSGYSDYEQPEEINLSMIQTSVGINTHITDIYNVPYNQLEQQIRLTIENIHEREEWEIINHPEIGLVSKVAPNMRLKTRTGSPTPEDLDDLLSLVWKKPSFFLAHPKAIAAFGRECTFRGVPPVIETINGGKFMTWRGIPLIPSDKMEIHYVNDVATSNILLMRVGENEQGVIGLNKAALGNNGLPSLTIQFMGVNECSVATYLVTKYFSVAILVPDALGMLINVQIGNYHHYD